MELDEKLCIAIINIDNSADWVYNYHCESCKKFLYSDNQSCRKCGQKITDPIKIPIPFVKSMTAIEKLIIWLHKQNNKELLNGIKNIMDNFLIYGYLDYKEDIVKLSIQMLK